MYFIQPVWQLRVLLLSSSFFQLFSLYWNFAYVATDRIIVVAVDVEQVAKTGNLLDKRQSLTHAKEGGGVDSGVGPGWGLSPFSPSLSTWRWRALFLPKNCFNFETFCWNNFVTLYLFLLPNRMQLLTWGHCLPWTRKVIGKSFTVPLCLFKRYFCCAM